MTLSFGSLCAGIGGMDLGLERAGMRCLWQIEIDALCRQILARHWPEVPRYEDIRRLSGPELAPVDLVCAGFPCQPVSVAGLRRGIDDPRWLWPEVARLLGVLRPRFALLENTPGLLLAGFGDVLGDLALLGYDAEWDCLPAAAFGAPHLRYRLFIAAYPHGDGRSGRQQQPEHLQRSSGAARPGAPPSDTVEERREQRPDRLQTRAPLTEDGAALPPGDTARLGRPSGRLVFPDASSEYPAALRTDHWQADSRFRRVVHGLSERVDRLTRSRDNRRIERLGNAVVPAVAEWIGRRIVEVAQ